MNFSLPRRFLWESLYDFNHINILIYTYHDDLIGHFFKSIVLNASKELHYSDITVLFSHFQLALKILSVISIIRISGIDRIIPRWLILDKNSFMASLKCHIYCCMHKS